MQISKIMTRGVITLSPDATVIDNIETFRQNKIHHIPVEAENGEIVGMVSSKDFENYANITKILAAPLDNPILVKDVMTEPIFSYFEDVEVFAAAEAMIDNNLHAIVVMDKKEKMIGILTSTDLLTYIVKEEKDKR